MKERENLYRKRFINIFEISKISSIENPEIKHINAMNKRINNGIQMIKMKEKREKLKENSKLKNTYRAIDTNFSPNYNKKNSIKNNNFYNNNKNKIQDFYSLNKDISSRNLEKNEFNKDEIKSRFMESLENYSNNNNNNPSIEVIDFYKNIKHEKKVKEIKKTERPKEISAMGEVFMNLIQIQSNSKKEKEIKEKEIKEKKTKEENINNNINKNSKNYFKINNKKISSMDLLNISKSKSFLSDIKIKDIEYDIENEKKIEINQIKQKGISIHLIMKLKKLTKESYISNNYDNIIEQNKNNKIHKNKNNNKNNNINNSFELKRYNIFKENFKKKNNKNNNNETYTYKKSNKNQAYIINNIVSNSKIIDDNNKKNKDFSLNNMKSTIVKFCDDFTNTNLDYKNSNSNSQGNKDNNNNFSMNTNNNININTNINTNTNNNNNIDIDIEFTNKKRGNLRKKTYEKISNLSTYDGKSTKIKDQRLNSIESLNKYNPKKEKERDNYIEGINIYNKELGEYNNDYYINDPNEKEEYKIYKINEIYLKKNTLIIENSNKTLNEKSKSKSKNIKNYINNILDSSSKSFILNKSNNNNDKNIINNNNYDFVLKTDTKKKKIKTEDEGEIFKSKKLDLFLLSQDEKKKQQKLKNFFNKFNFNKEIPKKLYELDNIKKENKDKYIDINIDTNINIDINQQKEKDKNKNKDEEKFKKIKDQYYKFVTNNNGRSKSHIPDLHVDIDKFINENFENNSIFKGNITKSTIKNSEINKDLFINPLKINKILEKKYLYIKLNSKNKDVEKNNDFPKYK
jgi:hypothetical protein